MKDKILKAGLKLYPNVTITSVADMLEVSKPSVFYHYRADEIKEAVEEHAVEIDDIQVIAMMITSMNERVDHMSNKDKLKYLVDSV